MKNPQRFAFAFIVVFAALLAGGCSAESRRQSQLEAAAKHLKAGDTERARIEFQNVLQKFPDDLTALEGLATIWHDRGATLRSIALYTKLTGLAPGNLGARTRRAQLLALLGQAAEARREAQAILEKSATAGEALLLFAETVRDAASMTETEKFLKDFPEKQTAWFHLATATLQNLRGDRAGAKSSATRAVSIDPKSPAAQSALGAVEALLGNAERAAAAYKAAAELAPARSRFRLVHAGYLAQSGSVPAAVAALEAVTKEAPDSQAAWRSLAQISLADKRPADALTALGKALALDPADYEAQIFRARAWLAQGETAKAVEDLRRIGRDFPGIGLEKSHLGLALLQAGDNAGATTALEEALAASPDNLEISMVLAQLHLRAGQHERVLQSMARVLQRRADLIQPYLYMIEAARGAGKLDSLAEAFRQNLAANPNQSLLHYMLGLTLRQHGKAAEARQSLENAIKISPDLAPAVAELAQLDLAEGKAAAALERAQGLATRAPKNPAGPLLVAQVHAAAKRWPEVEAAAIDVLLLDRNQAAASGLLGASFLARKSEPGMAARVDAFVAKFPGAPFALRLAAQVSVEAGAHGRGRDFYEKALAADASDVISLNNLANLNAEHLNQPDRALELARKARSLAPTNPAIADTLAWVHFRRKEYADALKLLEDCIKQAPGNGEMHYHLGMVHRAEGRKEPALAALRIAAAAAGDYPGKAEAVRVLAEMEKAP